MAKKRRKNVRRSRRSWIALVLILLFSLLPLWMTMQARTVNIRYAEVILPDLPPAFHRTKLLYITDIDMMGLNDLASMKRLVQKLAPLEADLILLGGDYTSPSWFQMLNGIAEDPIGKDRQKLFQSIEDLHPALGCYAISGDHDGDVSQLGEQMSAAGIKLIDGQLQEIAKDGSSLFVAGLDPNMTCLTTIEGNVRRSDCVIGLMHSPQRFSEAFVREASDGGNWMDLSLAGHTHGGQILLGNKTFLTLNEFEKRYRSGWFTDIIPFLVSQGVGCESINWRLGSQAEVWLIELCCK